MRNWIFPLLCSSMMMAGCQANNDDETAYDLRTDTTNPNYMSIRTDDRNVENLRARHIHNPSYIKLRGTGGGDSIQDDRALAKAIVNRTGDFTAERVSITKTNNADRMVITVDSNGRLDGKERRGRIAQLHESLVRSLPQYTIEIRER